MRAYAPFVTCTMLLIPGAVFAYDDTAIIERCDAEWGTDYSMVQYCRDQQRSAGKTFDRLKSQADTDETVATILAQCEGEWHTDYAMVIYCFEQQSSALRSLSILAEDIPPSVHEQISSHCSNEWGNDFSMVAYCVEQQNNAWRGMQ
ncbi:hypothetical protein [Roseovarius sp. D22-M7]|uniref:hypothetical protein n=1 Tax=Roseovarius sp. D22-M7 TaxID=3127116 RepID=UPI00300F997A